MKILFVLFLAGILTLPGTASAKRLHNKMSRCTFLYGVPEEARDELVKSYDTLHFYPGEHIADIGAKGANLLGVLSMFYQNFEITLEDIDSGCLSDNQADYVLTYYTALNGAKEPAGVMYKVVIGNDTSTTLPTAHFQKLFFINTFHEVTKPKQMLADLYRILAPGGTLYAEEKVTSSAPLKRKDCGHMMPVEASFLNAFANAGFTLVKVNTTDSYKRKGQRVKVNWYQFRKA